MISLDRSKSIALCRTYVTYLMFYNIHSMCLCFLLLPPQSRFLMHSIFFCKDQMAIIFVLSSHLRCHHIKCPIRYTIYETSATGCKRRKTLLKWEAWCPFIISILPLLGPSYTGNFSYTISLPDALLHMNSSSFPSPTIVKYFRLYFLV